MLKKIAKTLAISLCAVVLITALPFQVMAKPRNLSKSVKTGDIVYFGHYEQDGNKDNGKESIEWKVLDKKKGKVLLISKKILDVQPYNKEWEEITWEKCTLRTWLNKDFIKAAFTSEEVSNIQKSEIENKDNKEWKTEGGKDTTDKIFLLSIDETKKYFKTDKKRIGEITNYGIKRLAKLLEMSEKDVKAEFSENKNWEYWLRSPGDRQSYAAFVYNVGSVSDGGKFVYLAYGGVRPATWVNLYE